MLRTIREDWRGALLQGSVTATAFILLLIIASFLLPNAQENLLTDVRDGVRAQVCVLALPVDENGRDFEDVNECLAIAGMEPLEGP